MIINRKGSMCIKKLFVMFIVAVSSLPKVAHAQPVTFEELENHRIAAFFIYERTIRRIEENRIVKNESRNNITLTIRPENRIDQEFKNQTVAFSGREISSATGNISVVLNKPTKSRNGEMVLVFDQGSLIRLQTFNSGGRKITFAFKRDRSGFACTVDAPFSKEEGTGGAISTTSNRDNQRIEILAAKVTKSSCQVFKL